MKSEFVVEIWSDIVCPFCFLGKRKFEIALHKFEQKEDVHVIWRSFQLNPGIKTDPTRSVYSYLSEVKGMTEDVARQMTEQIRERGNEVGINYNFDATRVNNTLIAHSFLHFALEKGKQNEAKELLLSAYFEQGKNVDDPSILLQIGSELGFNAEVLEEVLTKDKYNAAVQEDMDLAHKIGIQGVPFFVFDRKYAVSGAQEVPVFQETLIKAYDEWKTINGNVDLNVSQGEACTSDGEQCS